MTSAFYQVNSYHINVGAGDGAIHILSTGGTDYDRPIVLRAFLVDGGRGSALEGIEATISWIEAHYICDGPFRSTLKFDGFIITHWDGDHYEGIRAYLRKQVQAEYARVLDPAKTIIPTAKYGNEDAQTGHHGSPESFFLAPHWPYNPEDRQMPGWIFDPDELRPDLHYELGNDMHATSLLKLRHGNDWLLGRNLFSSDLYTSEQNDEPLTERWPQMRTLTELMTLGNPIVNPFPTQFEEESWPALYCIAANKSHLYPGQGAMTTEANKSSLCFIVAWDKQDPPHVSHYFAGDAEDKLEKTLGNWIGTNIPITSMKLSHHGSATSNPPENFLNFSPRNIIVSAGDQFGHPRWEVLLVMDAWFASLQLFNTNRNRKPFFPCRWPAYLVREDTNVDNFVVDKFSVKMLNEVNKNNLITWADTFRDEWYSLRNEVFDSAKPIFPLDRIRRKIWVHTQLTGKLPDDTDIRHEICLYSEHAMRRTSCLPTDGDQFQAIGQFGGNMMTGFGMELESDLTAETAMREIVAMHIRSAPREATFIIGGNVDGSVEMIGVNSVAQGDGGPALISRPLSTSTLAAFKASSRIYSAWDDDRPVCPVPHLGTDQPRRFDLSLRNPKWPTPAALGHVESIDSDNGNQVKYLRDRSRPSSWIHVDDSSDPELSDDEVWDVMGDVMPNTPTRHQEQLTVFRRQISLYIVKPAIYIASESIIKEKWAFPPDVQVVALYEDNPLFGFVDTLHSRTFSLAKIPVAGEPVPFAPDDDWFHWLSRFCGWEGHDPSAEFAMYMTADKWEMEKQTLLKFSIEMPLTSGKMLRFDTSDGAKHSFEKTGATNEPVSLVELTNMLISRRTIVYGLNELEKPLETTLAEVAKLMSFDLDRFPVVRAIIGSVPLTLDTKEDYRNALWFRPGLDYETHLRLQFHIDPTTLQGWLKKLSDTIVVQKLCVIGRKQASYSYQKANDVLLLRSSMRFLCEISVPSINLLFDTGITVSEDRVSLCLTLKRPKTQVEISAAQGTNGTMKDIAEWLSGMMGSEILGVQDILKSATAKDGALDDNSIMPRRVELLAGLDKNGSFSTLISAFVQIEACVMIGKPAAKSMDQVPVVFLFTLGWTKGMGIYLKGKLWTATPPTPFSRYDRALPEYEDYFLLEPIAPVDPKNQLRTLNLERLLSSEDDKIANIPAGLPTEIYHCEIGLSQKEIWFSGAIRCPEPDPSKPVSSQPPPIALENLELEASYKWKTEESTDAGLRLRLAIAVNLYLGAKVDKDQDYDQQLLDAAKLHGEILYDKGDWSLTAGASDLKMSHLACFWHDDDQSSVMEFLGQIAVDFVEVKYEYSKGANAAAKKLTFTGKMSLGKVAKLKLEYRNVNADDWLFTASLAAETALGDTATIGQVLSSFIDQDVLLTLPSAIRDAKLQGERGQDPLRVVFASEKKLRVLAVIISIGHISLWFLQISQDGGPVKRLVKAVISEISVDVPMFNATITSPWEQLFFMWVQDTTEQTKDDATAALTGVTDVEYTNLKACLKRSAGMSDDDFLLYKSVKKPSEKTESVLDDEKKKAEVVIAAGSHLVVVRKTDQKLDIVLDYLFGKQQKPKKDRRVLRTVKGQQNPPDPSGAEKGTKAPFKLKVGPLSVENISLWFKDGMFGITLDASLLMGPVGLSLVGFNIGVPFGGEYSLANPPPPEKIEWGLQGLVVSLDRPPLTVAGGFVHDTSDPDVDKYAGGLIVGFKPWTFQAMGVYANVTKKSIEGTSTTTISLNPLDCGHQARSLALRDGEGAEEETFTFVFILIKLNGPLFSVGFADFAGLVGGFGMNSDVLLPTVEQVVDFPFIKERDSNDSTKNPVDEMRDLMKDVWFRPAEGMYWAAAGVRITAFQMLAANVVFVIQFGGKSLIMGLYGVATCDVPALDSPVKFAHVELGIICTMDTQSGFFKLEAQLSPRSFVLAPQCHLTGGLALYAWFKGDREHDIEAGDWVLTIGGYHQAFRAPTQYPRPPRLGIYWSLGSCLSVTGEAYFAITPKVCMGGGRIHAALSLGALYAWFDAFLDFLMNFEPFYFQLQARIAVGVRFTLDLWLVTVRINAEVSASLDLTGPPFGGVVHVDFWVFGFDVKFGPDAPKMQEVKLDRFWRVVLKSSSAGGTGTSSSFLTGRASEKKDEYTNEENQDTAAIFLTCESGLEPRQDPNSTEKDKKWFVKGSSFVFSLTFQFVITSASLKEHRIVKKEGEEEPTTEWRDAEATIEPQYSEQVFAKPMQLVDPLVSEVEVDITAPRVDDTGGSVHVLRDVQWKDQKWRVKPVVSAVPRGVWGKYDKNQDPTILGNRIESLLTGSNPTIPLVTALRIQPPLPAEADDKVNNFNVILDRMQEVFDSSSSSSSSPPPLFPHVRDESHIAWTPRGKSGKVGDVVDKWKEDDVGERVVRVWGARLGFDVVVGEGGRHDDKMKGDKEGRNRNRNPLTGRVPERLLERFGQIVPALPMVGVGF
ncbi:hypothetical protein GGS20DRAFT_587462 [Poronia punctata]|nr:hypothetical protein GGS20DRAFT_587462 [Poronia punctata]